MIVAWLPWIGTPSNRTRLLLALVCVIAAVAAPPAAAQTGSEVKSVTRKSQGQNAPIDVFHVRGNVYMVAGAGCNVTVQVGEQYVIVVDTGSAKFTDELIAAIQNLTNLPILFLPNTNSDADHTGGDEKFYHAGWSLPNPDRVDLVPRKEVNITRLILPPGASILASLKTLDRIDLPTAIKNDAVSYGPEGLKLYNGEAVVFYHIGKAHSDGDSMVFFRASDVVSAGDIFTTASYPVIETENGGSVGGFIDALNDLIEILVPKYGEEGGTYVIPGHGRLSDRADVVNYRDMVTIIYGRIQEMVKGGMNLDQVLAARPTLDYDGIYGAESGKRFVEAVYRDLTRKTN
jgi:cyclase